MSENNCSDNKIAEKETAQQIFKQAVDAHNRTFDKFVNSQASDAVVKAAEIIIESLRSSGKILICGNGGSAADAQHIAGEFIGRFRKDRPALPAIALSTDTSVMSCVANDYGYDKVFQRQVAGLIKPEDILIALSTSGTSANILAAAETALAKGAKVIAFTGKEQTPLQQKADLTICVEADNTAAAQEIHQVAYHAICGIVEKLIFG